MATKTPTTTTTPTTSPEKVAARPAVVPAVDIYENPSEILLLADLPAVRREDLRIHVDKDVRAIEADRASGPEGAVISQGFAAAGYARRFQLPPGIDTEKIAAELRNGVLRLRLPKSERLKPRQIEVKVG